MKKNIKIVLTILLLLCILKLPYGFYVFIRWAGMIGFGYLAYCVYNDKQYTSSVIFVLLAILFQPFEKIALGRTIWNIVDIIIAVGLIISLIMSDKKKDK
jgi:hypothetical protein